MFMVEYSLEGGRRFMSLLVECTTSWAAREYVHMTQPLALILRTYRVRQ